jgi:3-hydroxyisobutyrate dehydrogenase
MQLALQLGRELNVPMRLANMAAMELTEALNRGWGDLDSQAFLDVQRERAGIERIEIPIDQIKAVQEQD